MVAEDDDRWVSIPAAAKALGVSRQALDHRIKRGTLQTRANNRGQKLVKLSPAFEVTVDKVNPPLKVKATVDPQEPPQPAPGGSNDATERRHLAEIERLQHAHTAELSRITEAAALERARADAQAARQLAERDSLHLDTLGRLQAQAAAERSLWLERVDAAELRAERVEQRFDQVLDALLTERRQLAPEPRRPWWRRWLG